LLGGQDQVVGLDHSTLAVHPVAAGPALPGGFGRVIIVDRTYAVRAAANAPTSASETVWLTPSVAGTFPAKLQKAGVTILSTQSATEQTALYSRQGPALAILLFLAGACLGALLAAGGAMLNLHLTGRRRTYELAAMSAIGVRRRTLLASLYAEQAVLLAFGIGVGVVAGVVGAVLALPSVPEFADQPSAPPMLYGLHSTSSTPSTTDPWWPGHGWPRLPPRATGPATGPLTPRSRARETTRGRRRHDGRGAAGRRAGR
jgi:ABC-type antimicrobial peptide transport system permease subunit